MQKRRAAWSAARGWIVPLIVAALATIPSKPPSAAEADTSASLAGLVAAERAFSALSVEKGMKEAFLTFLGEGSVVFRPGPLEGRAFWSGRPNPSGTLIWAPAYAEVAAGGDLGVTTGPWEFRAPAADSTAAPSIAYGHFISVWKRQGSAWKVIVDLGTTHAKPTSGGLESGDFTEGPAHAGHAGRARFTSATELAGLDHAMGRAAKPGLAAAYASRAAADVRLNRDGFEPILGLAASCAALDTLVGAWSFETAGSGRAAEDDMAYTYGLATRIETNTTAARDSSTYVHVWRRGEKGRWELSLAVLNPRR